MITPRLESITITDFRSIKGTVTIPLGAPVVLIQGANGTGKTSLLSAIELALTGEIPSLRRLDPNYFMHLPHCESSEARILLDLSRGSESSAPSSVNMIVTTKGPQGAPLFDGSRARFFAERCYLAQSTLGRLLEIYQYPDVTEPESPLTRFVKDVLGLDQLDAIIDGLYAADDVRRIRNLVPAFRETEHARANAIRHLAELASSARALDEQIHNTRTSLAAILDALPGLTGPLASSPSLDTLIPLLETEPEEQELVTLASVRRELASFRSDWSELADGPEADDRAFAEDADSEARKAVTAWTATVGRRLEDCIEGLRDIFPDLPSLASTDPDTAAATAIDRVSHELKRCDSSLAIDDLAAAQLSSLDQVVDRERARLSVIESQISELASDAAGLSHALASLVPHVHAELCPVCGRDYSEVSQAPLVVRLSSQVSRLTEQGDRLEALAKARSEVLASLSQADRDREAVLPHRISQDIRVGLKTRSAELSESLRRLIELRELASRGSSILSAAALARGRLAKLRELDQRATDIRLAVSGLCKSLAQQDLGDTESVDDALGRLEHFIKVRNSQLLDVVAERRRGLAECRRLQHLLQQAAEAQEIIARERSTLATLTTAFDLAEHRRLEAKRIGAASRTARANIVRRVFNDSLNTLWRDLFVRLAPTEPYVPAFQVPDSTGGPVVAILETIHRSGSRGGTPGAMLSAGNLNTAALTLFLALHLSVSTQLPWLTLDDPVQSMDEVHVSQFAALLRTLSKNHDRQIIIAVHDRALFDYLALELSPAFPDDQLLTLELGRSDSGASLVEPIFRIWEPDKAFALT